MDNSYSSSGGFAAIGLFPILIGLAFVVFIYAAMWRIFTKAGKPGWAALIPIYNAIVLLEIVGKPVWWFLLYLIPCVGIVYSIWTVNLLSKSFGKSEGFTVGLLLLGIVFYPILAWGDAVYLGPSAKEAQVNRFGATDYQKPFDSTPPPPPPAAPEA